MIFCVVFFSNLIHGMSLLKMGTGVLQNIVGMLVYMTAQLLGMFVASAASYLVYSSNENSVYNKMIPSPTKDYIFSCLYSTCPSDLPNSQVCVTVEICYKYILVHNASGSIYGFFNFSNNSPCSNRQA